MNGAGDGSGQRTYALVVLVEPPVERVKCCLEGNGTAEDGEGEGRASFQKHVVNL